MKCSRHAFSAAAAIVVVAGGVAGYCFWKQYEASLLPAGIVSVNGRVEATQVDISTKIPARVVEIVPHEGDSAHEPRPEDDLRHAGGILNNDSVGASPDSANQAVRFL